jgi:broad specificity phosphatase PhoE
MTEEKKVRRFIIGRHGETDFNAERRVQGTSNDSILTNKGISQAAALGIYISKSEAITRTFCSPLQRCRQTYAKISECCSDNGNPLPEPTILENLKEIELKEWQGRLRNDIMVEDKTNWEIFKANPCDLRLQDGSFAPVLDCFQRAISNWDVIRADAASNSADVIFIMCHGAIGQCMLLQALGLDKKEYGKSRRYALDNCECFEVEFETDESEHSSRWRRIDTSQAVSDWLSTYSSHLISSTLATSR